MKTIAQIAAELQGYDPQALSAADVNTFLERLVEPVSATEDLPLFSALGRVLAQDVISPISVPPHDNSAMDGYAFAGDQLVAGQPLTLRVVGTKDTVELDYTGRTLVHSASWSQPSSLGRLFPAWVQASPRSPTRFLTV